MSLYYCLATPAGPLARAAALAASALAVATLLASLSSVAEDYFTPGLTSLAAALRLPPRLAGATLLALGNGAPDIGAAVAAVRTGEVDLAHGALLGGGLFVGCGVAGCVLRAAGGAHARGALVRDVGAYGVAVAATALILKSGAAGPGAAAALLTLYGLYVVAVAAADTARVVADARRDAAADDEPLLGPPPEADLPPGTAPGGGGSRRVSRLDEVEMTLSDLAASLSAASPRLIDGDVAPLSDDGGGGGDGFPASPLAPSPADAAASALTVAAAALARAVAVVDAPLAFGRAVTIPVADRPRWLPPSLALAPPACVAYLGAPWPAVVAAAAVSFPVAALTAAAALPAAAPVLARLPRRAAPALLSAASALGFIAAALWVDGVASELVGALQLVGVASRVPPSVLGGTLLAWGNSVGDLVTNVAVARRGLANMALTACYAGPATNLLIGLGAGVARAAAASPSGSIPVRLSPAGAAATAYALAMVAVVLGVGAACGRRLPARTAWGLGGIYGAYVATAVALSAAGKR